MTAQEMRHKEELHQQKLKYEEAIFKVRLAREEKKLAEESKEHELRVAILQKQASGF